MVTWTYRGHRELIDCDSEQLAGTIAVLLAEASRESVAVSEVEYEPDPEMKGRIWERLEKLRRIELPEVFK